jgi:2-polyprenyl-6-methoxyphenol hydroxylase-like FAD-dependent oxidoreductase
LHHTGIAGLAAGLALREFADVQILESAHMLKEVGAAVTLRGGVIRFLRSWGIDPTAVGAVPTSEIRVYNGAGELLHTKPLEDTASCQSSAAGAEF